MTHQTQHPKYTFWNVDTQFDFMRDDATYKGKLPVVNAVSIEPALARLTALAQTYHVQRVNTGDWHDKNSAEISDTPDFKTTYPEHCMKHTKGAKFVPATAPYMPTYIDWDPKATAFIGPHLRDAENIVIYKDKFDVFAGNKRADAVADIVLRREDGTRKTVVVYGVATNVCVDYAVMGLRERNYNVLVPQDAIKHLPHLDGVAGMGLEDILKKWTKAGVVLTTVDKIETMLGGAQ